MADKGTGSHEKFGELLYDVTQLQFQDHGVLRR